MTTFAQRFENTFRRLLPSPLAIAFVLTVIAFLAALVFTRPDTSSIGSYSLKLGEMWQSGLWQSGLLAFTVQMMLILVLGHVIALSPPVTRFTDLFSARIQNGTQAAVWVGGLTIAVALFNWGLGLIFGAVMARKVAESAHRRGLKISYPLIGAAGYSGLMVWHGGISGSAPLKANEPGHLTELTGLTNVPEAVGFSDTVFSVMNGFASVLILLAVCLTLYFLSKIVPTKVPPALTKNVQLNLTSDAAIGAERLDKSKKVGMVVGLVLLGFALYLSTQSSGLSFLTPNYINFLLLGLAFALHRSFSSFSSALDDAISGASGILIQFPLYFGILGLVRDSGLVNMVASSLIESSSATSFPFTTLFSAGLINIFVPSGGGQWAIQGPILVEASQALNVPLGKGIMALAYGDQLTNMLQPFWALPLLGITQLKAREILPYTLILMMVGMLVYGLTLALF